MKVILREPGRMLLRFERGEEFVAALAAFAKKEGIAAAAFVGIGAAENITIARFSPRIKGYEDLSVKDEFEIASLSGDISLKEGAPFVHAHAVLSDRNFKALGGHLKRCVISATCEVFFIPFTGRVSRRLDPTVGIHLLEPQAGKK